MSAINLQRCRCQQHVQRDMPVQSTLEIDAMLAAPEHDRSEFITWHLCLLILVGALGFGVLSINLASLAIPLVIALMPLPFYCVPRISNETAKTCLYSTGVAVLLVLVIYAVCFGALIWMLSGVTYGW